MKIIVTGCKGQLGTEILKQLREGRSEIGPIPEKLLNATVIAVDLPDLDISNYKMVDEFIRRNRPDVIINCAAYTHRAVSSQAKPRPSSWTSSSSFLRYMSFRVVISSSPRAEGLTCFAILTTSLL